MSWTDIFSHDTSPLVPGEVAPSNFSIPGVRITIPSTITIKTGVGGAPVPNLPPPTNVNPFGSNNSMVLVIVAVIAAVLLFR